MGIVMWQRLSLRSRINLLMALVLTLGLAINVARLVLEAGPRVQAEDQSVTRLAREFVETIVGGLSEAPDPEGRLDRIVQDLKRLRHVSITRQTDLATAADVGEEGDDARSVPGWFVTLIHPRTTSVAVPISLPRRSTALVITSIPNDEIAEIWDGVLTQLAVGSTVALALFLITMTVVGRALAPLEALSQAMSRIESGSYSVHVEPGGAPEFAAICTKMNHLAETLGEAVEDKRRLAERAVSLQDRERKEIARELHDEFGPYLFALRVHAGALIRIAKTGVPDADGLLKHGSAILEQVNDLQQFTRRILERLRPAGLTELGLSEALGALVRLWRDAHPGVVVETGVSQSLGDMGETAELTIYRVVQEALTNVFRHSGATHVSVTIEPVSKSSGNGLQGGAARVRVQDNGEGLPADHKFGLGLTGMRERVMALGGTMTVASTESGLTVEAVVPRGARS